MPSKLHWYWGVGPVRRYHSSWMKSSTSNQTPPPRACSYPGITRSRSFCELCTAFKHVSKQLRLFCTKSIPVSGTSVASIVPCHNTRGTGTSFVYQVGTYVCSVRPCHNTRDFWNFCKTFMPVPGTSVSSVRCSYLYTELLWDLHATCHNTGGYGCSTICAGSDLLWVMYVRATIPWTSISSVTLMCTVPDTSGNKCCKTAISLPGIHKPYRT